MGGSPEEHPEGTHRENMQTRIQNREPNLLAVRRANHCITCIKQFLIKKQQISISRNNVETKEHKGERTVSAPLYTTRSNWENINTVEEWPLWFLLSLSLLHFKLACGDSLSISCCSSVACLSTLEPSHRPAVWASCHQPPGTVRKPCEQCSSYPF